MTTPLLTAAPLHKVEIIESGSREEEAISISETHAKAGDVLISQVPNMTTSKIVKHLPDSNFIRGCQPKFNSRLISNLGALRNELVIPSE